MVIIPQEVRKTRKDRIHVHTCCLDVSLKVFQIFDYIACLFSRRWRSDACCASRIRIATGAFSCADDLFNIRGGSQWTILIRSSRRLELARSRLSTKGLLKELDEVDVSRVHKETKQLVAIKILNLDTAEGKLLAWITSLTAVVDEVADIRTEISLLTQLKLADVQNVTRYYGSHLYGSKLWIIMDYCHGGSIRTLVNRPVAGNTSYG